MDRTQLEQFLGDPNIPDADKQRAVDAFKQEQQGSGWGPTIARAAPAVAGSIIGGTIGGPLGAAVGGSAGAVAGDLYAQEKEVLAGERDRYYPARTAAEGLLGGVGGVFTAGAKTVGTAAMRAAIEGVSSNTLVSITEGKGIPSIGQNTIAAISAAGLGGAFKYGLGKFGLEELTGDRDLATLGEHIAKGGEIPGLDADNARELRYLFSEEPPPVVRERVPVLGPTGKKLETTAGKPFTRRDETGHFQKLGELGYNPDDVRRVFGDLRKQEYPILRDRQNRLRKIVPKFEAAALQDEFGIPVFRDYKMVSDAYRGMEGEIGDYAKPLESALKGTSLADRRSMLEWMLAPANQRKNLKLDPVLEASTRKAYQAFDKYLKPFGLTADETFGSIIPAIARGEDVAGLNPRAKKLLEYVVNDELNLGEPDILHLGTRLLKAGLFQKHVAPEWDRVYTKYNDQSIPQPVRDMMLPYLHAIRGRGDSFQKRIADALNAMFERADPTEGKRIAGSVRNDVENWVQLQTSVMYAGTMGYRVGPIIRNSTQSIQTGMIMGPEWLALGMKKALTPEGQELIQKNGVMGEAMAMQELGNLAGGPISRVVRREAQRSMAGFGEAEKVARYPTYLGMYEKAKWAAQEAKGNWETFLDKSDIDRWTPAEQAYLKELYDDQRFDELYDQAGKMFNDNVHFMYSPAEKDPVLRSSLGRVALPLMNWPTSYAAYLKRNFIDHNGPNWKRYRDLGRWFAANAGLATTFAGLGTLVGDKDSFRDNLGWTFLAPAIPNAPPTVEAVTAATDFGTKLASGKGFDKNSGKEFFRGVSAATIPFGLQSFVGLPRTGAGGDIMNALNEPDTASRVGRILGLKRGRQ